MESPYPLSGPLPSVRVEAGLTDYSYSLFTDVSLHPDAIGRVLKAYAPDADTEIVDTVIVASGMMPTREVDYAPVGIAAIGRNRVFTEHHPFSNGIDLYMGNVAMALHEPPLQDQHPSLREAAERAREDRLKQAADPSVLLIDALSRRGDMLSMGREGLRAEQQRAEKMITVKKGVVCTLGAVGVAAASAAVAYANHKTGFMSKTPVDIIAGAAALAGGVWAWLDTQAAAVNEKLMRHWKGAWPVDLRARRRQEEYRAARANGDIGELVAYQLALDPPEASDDRQ